MDRKKKLKKFRKDYYKKIKSDKTGVPNVNSVKYKHIIVEYMEDTDDFYIDSTMMLNKKCLSIRGIIDARYFGGKQRGLLIETPKREMTKGYFDNHNCYELFLKDTDVPKLFALCVGYFNTTGDYFDSNKFDKSKHGPVIMHNEDFGWVDDVDIMDHMDWRHSY